MGYRAPLSKALSFAAFGVATAGMAFLAAKWSPKLHAALSLSRCPLSDADYVAVKVRGRFVCWAGKGGC